MLQLRGQKNCKLEVLRMLVGVDLKSLLLQIDQRKEELKQLELTDQMRNPQKQ